MPLGMNEVHLLMILLRRMDWKYKLFRLPIILYFIEVLNEDARLSKSLEGPRVAVHELTVK